MQVAAVARGAPQIGRCLINIARTGVAPGGELHDLNRANVDLARGAIARNRDVVIGVKARHVEQRCRRQRSRGAAARAGGGAPFDLPVMIHVGQNYSPLRSILALLKRGDIVTHMYAPAPNGILDDKGKLIPDVMAARRRGILFDFGNGVADHFDWATVEKPRPSRASGPTRSPPTGTRCRDHRRRRLAERHVEVPHVRHAAERR